MKRNLKISVSKKPRMADVVTCRDVFLRERILNFLFGSKQHVTILIPGDRVDEVVISETEKGGKDDGKERNDSEDSSTDD